MKAFFIWLLDNLDLSFYNNLIPLYGLILAGAFYFVFLQFGINEIASGILSGTLGMKLAHSIVR